MGSHHILDVFACKYGGLHYTFRSIEGGRHTLVLLHGLGASHAQFLPMVDALNKRVSVVLIDLSGHGENTPKTDDQIDFDSFRDLILCLCDDLNIEKAVFAGISMGSALALSCAIKRPDLVQKAVIIRPSWFENAGPEHLSIVDRCAKWLLAGSIETAVDQLEQDPAYIEMRDDVPLAAASIKGLFDRRHAKAHAPVLSKMFHSRPFKSVNDLRAVKCPAIVVGTQADSLHPVAIANATANALPNAELKILPPRYLQPEKHQIALTELILDHIGDAA